jgi:hypothetical protein
MKSKRFELLMPEWLKDAVKDAAEKKRVPMAEYIKDALKRSLASSESEK